MYKLLTAEHAFKEDTTGRAQVKSKEVVGKTVVVDAVFQVHPLYAKATASAQQLD
jgi:hypothetical protein